MSSASKRPASPADLSPLAAALRAGDPDRYLSVLFAPADRREALFALYAFDHEIAKAKRIVREPMAGLIRLQWWRDALDGIDRGDILAHPVVHGLGVALSGGLLDRLYLDAAIAGRETEFEAPPPDGLAAFETHLTATNGGIVKAAARMLGGDSANVLAVADHVGRALGLLEKLRLLGAERQEQPVWLPAALLADQHLHGQVSREEITLPMVRVLEETLAHLAQRHLELAREKGRRLPRRLLPAFFPGTLAAVRLRDIHRTQDHPALATAPMRLLWHWLRGNF